MVFNQQMPVAQWKQAAEAQGLAAFVREQVAMAAFYPRASMLGSHDVAAAVAPKAVARYYTAGGSDEDRRFAAAFALLHLPGSAPLHSGRGESRDGGSRD